MHRYKLTNPLFLFKIETMIRRFYILICAVFLVACDDGDILTVDLDFDQELGICDDFENSYLIFDTRTDPNESLTLVLPKPQYEDLFLNPTPEGEPVIIDISPTQARFNYRTYNINPDGLLCDVLPNSDLIIREDYPANQGTVEVTVTIEDDDNDGIPNIFEYGPGGIENPKDSDGDGIPDYLDEDDDNDNVKTKFEINDPVGDGNPANNPLDSDGDGIPDYLDEDDDGDGVLTRLEDANGDKNPRNDMANNAAGELVPHYLNPDETTPYDFPGYTNDNTYTKTVRTHFIVKDIDLEILRTDYIDLGTLTTIIEVEQN
ncbi:hypothetical protein DFQ11_102476 [Winogradskyella epiphytica]|uniref:Thrombospondin type 3 repeat-containing protein n=2 Tax=Winogradskyella epiphytica TaxID=262005 RepID=A0A2V4YEI3_9FLAO|nr:hypothetical protein DFQ11_102476 [Winogradskyella epiphytica]GGW61933.1 hypothetical protein GCM10008085_11960 [Winogradskyella epiphytica]